MTFQLTSSAFTHESQMPARHTCNGFDVSPPLSWSGSPERTKSFAIVLEDPDAPDPRAPKRTWVHWVLYDIPSTTVSLSEDASHEELPARTREGRNDWHTVGYRGPCPPVGRHRYFFKLYALDTLLGDLDFPGKAKLEEAMREHVLGQATLMCTYGQ